MIYCPLGKFWKYTSKQNSLHGTYNLMRVFSIITKLNMQCQIVLNVVKQRYILPQECLRTILGLEVRKTFLTRRFH